MYGSCVGPPTRFHLCGFDAPYNPSVVVLQGLELLIALAISLFFGGCLLFAVGSILVWIIGGIIGLIDARRRASQARDVTTELATVPGEAHADP